MTLDEASNNCIELINNSKTCDKCKDEHIQLYEWLSKLKRIKEGGDK